MDLNIEENTLNINVNVPTEYNISEVSSIIYICVKYLSFCYLHQGLSSFGQ